MNDILKPFNVGESYFLLRCGPPCEMVFIEETETDYIFIDHSSPWGGPKDDILKMFKEKTLTQDKDEILRQANKRLKRKL